MNIAKKKKSPIMELMEKDVIDNFFKDEREIKLNTLIFLNKKLENLQKLVMNYFNLSLNPK